MIWTYEADFTKAINQFPENTFDAIITDPPYAKEYSHLWESLGRLAFKTLKPGGSLLSIVPHYLLPEVLATMEFERLKYRWIICMEQNGGPHPRMAMGIEVAWKPVVWWVKGSWPQGRGYRIDWFRSDWTEADGTKGTKLHKWQQSLTWAKAMLKHVPAGGTVLDPMCGTGTVLLAARELGYSAVGIDNDPEVVAIARERLK